MIITTTRLDFLLYTVFMFGAGAVAAAGVVMLRGRRADNELPDVPDALPARHAISGSEEGSGSGPVANLGADRPAAQLPHLGGPRPLGWETPAEEIDRLEAQLEALYLADRERIRDEADRLAAELLGDVRAVQELLEAGTLARPDWLPPLVPA